MLNLYQSILSDVLTRFEDKIIILDGWPIKVLELLVGSSYPLAIPQSFTSQMIDGNFDYVLKKKIKAEKSKEELPKAPKGLVNNFKEWSYKQVFPK